MDAATRRLVRRRAAERCEYCLLRQGHIEATHHIEHIVAKQHGGSDAEDNFALSCYLCNAHKGQNLTGIDPESGGLVSLFHPRRERWDDHFTFRGAEIEGLTPVGRATVHVLAMNDRRHVARRMDLLIVGEWP